MREYAQCFYNCHYNEGDNNGQSKFIYGFFWAHLLGDNCEPLHEQIIKHAKLNEGEVFNFQINQLTPFPNSAFEENPNL